MCKQHWIARGIVQAYIHQKPTFKYEEVQSTIIRKGGILRVSTGVTVADYLHDLEKEGKIKYIPSEDLFEVEKS